jgi:very-short-patch-repair endonuclease
MHGQTCEKILANKLQRGLRQTMTDAEKTLWQVLRRRQVFGHKFRRQHPYGNFILDFVCLENRLAIEIDGGQHGEQMEYDDRRTQHLQAAGFHVLRFWNHEVLQDLDAVKERIGLAIGRLETHPHPEPPLEGEGDTSCV